MTISLKMGLAIAGAAMTGLCAGRAGAQADTTPDAFTQGQANAAAKNPASVRFQLVLPVALRHGMRPVPGDIETGIAGNYPPKAEAKLS